VLSSSSHLNSGFFLPRNVHRVAADLKIKQPFYTPQLKLCEDIGSFWTVFQAKSAEKILVLPSNLFILHMAISA
jgi:hypothetical protein